MKIAVGLFALGSLLVPALARADAGPPTAWVHLEGSRVSDVTLEFRRDPRAAWSVACRGACDTRLALDAEYRVTGPGVRDSDPFRLRAAADEHVILHVNASSSLAHDGGAVLLVASPFVLLGGLYLLAGAVSAGIGDAYNCDGSPGAPTNCSGHGAQGTGGELLIAAGVVGLIAGAALLVSNGSTRLSQDTGREAEPRVRFASVHTAP